MIEIFIFLNNLILSCFFQFVCYNINSNTFFIIINNNNKYFITINFVITVNYKLIFEDYIYVL